MRRDFEFPHGDAGGEQPAARSAIARVIDCGGGRLAALPPRATLELLEQPQWLRVPGAARHALGLLAWQGRRIPLIDVGALMGLCGKAQAPRYALVVAWQGRAVEHGGIALDRLPEFVNVDDGMACGLPPESGWAQLAAACFRHGGKAVPILDAGRLFDGL
jgi:chemotaxis signal transduction protein